MQQFRQAYSVDYMTTVTFNIYQTYGGLRVTRMVNMLYVTLEMYLLSISSLNAGTINNAYYFRSEFGTWNELSLRMRMDYKMRVRTFVLPSSVLLVKGK